MVKNRSTLYNSGIHFQGITPDIEKLIDQALLEDLGGGDVTTDALLPHDQRGKAAIIPRVDGVLAGIDIAAAVFKRLDITLEWRTLLQDGSRIIPADSGMALDRYVAVAEISGPIGSILKAERTALNFVQHLSGIATETRKYVDAVEGYSVRILDTRKTIPGLRALGKYAVRVGGGYNHRRGLGDGILVKDNHIEALRSSGLSIAEIVERVRENSIHTLQVEIEVEDLDGAREALDSGADVLLFDNMSTEDIAVGVKQAQGLARTEASGGITLDNVREVASTGVDMISVGALTHSAKSLDVGLDFIED
ncbi:MAG: carboxylating nicotinate-nucleotide diphosphorylase [SAR202 cluster bacterium]|jgi:nicotinate-nucleotide pyrophosphorylase (carboxylating)|nr:carboxylating nicotinate-nucleotide diphosphorylase [SAR202 cluster bacterium]